MEGTNLRAWLFTILRNIYYSEYRKRRREVADPDGAFAAKLATAPAQGGHMDLLDFRAALQQLPSDQREALILIGASGLSYEEAAGVCGCAIGTMKSRVNRARIRLAEMLSSAPMKIFDNPLPIAGHNRDERALRGVTLGRANWTFAGSDAGGHRAACV